MSLESKAPLNPPRHWGWISGWGIPPTDFETVVKAAWPDDQHTVFAPTENAVTNVLRIKPDIMAGYSLGALILLATELPLSPIPLIGIAPFLAFDAEANLGGTTPSRSRSALRTKFSQHPLASVKLYLRLAGLGDMNPDSLPYQVTDLAWGLDALERLRAREDNTRSAQLFSGSNDPLIKSDLLDSRCDRFEIIANAGHDFRSLIPQISNRL